MRQNATATAVRGLRNLLPGPRALACDALIAAAGWLATRNDGHGPLDMLAGQPAATGSSQVALYDGARTSRTAMASAAGTAGAAATTASSDRVGDGLSRLLDLGAGRCIPCKMMAPILDELKDEYEGIADVEFMDVWQRPGLAKEYGIEAIPTHIFLGGSGQRVRIDVSAPPETPVRHEKAWNRICELGRDPTEKHSGRDEKESGNGPEVKC